MLDQTLSPSVDTQGILRELVAEANGLVVQARRLGSALDSGAILSAQRQVLELLMERGPQTVPQLARVRMTSRQNIQIVVNRLSELGMVQSVENPRHRRSRLIQITPAGTSFLKRDAGVPVNDLPVDSSVLSLSEMNMALRTLRTLRSAWLNVPQAEGDEKIAVSEPTRFALTEPETVVQAEEDELPVALL